MIHLTDAEREAIEAITNFKHLDPRWRLLAQVILRNAAPACQLPEGMEHRTIIFKESEPFSQAYSNPRLLRELVRHCWVHSGYQNCGYAEMDRDMRDLYSEIIKQEPDVEDTAPNCSETPNSSAERIAARLVEKPEIISELRQRIENEEPEPWEDKPAPPKFAVGDRVKIGCDNDDVFNGKTGTVEVIATGKCSHPYRVRFNEHHCFWYSDCQLTPAPRTITVYDGAAFVADGRYGFVAHKIIDGIGRTRWYGIWSDGAVADISFERNDGRAYNLDWILKHYTPDPARDVHPVGSEWETPKVKIGNKWNLVCVKSLYALVRLIGHDPIVRGGQWHATIADATRGARRADGVEVRAC